MVGKRGKRGKKKGKKVSLLEVFVSRKDDDDDEEEGNILRLLICQFLSLINIALPWFLREIFTCLALSMAPLAHGTPNSFFIFKIIKRVSQKHWIQSEY